MNQKSETFNKLSTSILGNRLSPLGRVSEFIETRNISKKSEIKSEVKSDLINFLCEVQQKLVTPGGKPSLVHLSYQLDLQLSEIWKRLHPSGKIKPSRKDQKGQLSTSGKQLIHFGNFRLSLAVGNSGRGARAIKLIERSQMSRQNNWFSSNSIRFFNQLPNQTNQIFKGKSY